MLKLLLILSLFVLPANANEILTAQQAHEQLLKTCDPDALQDCFEKDLNTANHPFLMSHGKKTQYVVLLLHGLSDSPYFFKDIASTLFAKGMNIYAPLWTGHATKPEHLSQIQFEDWIGGPKKSGDLQWVMKKALEYGDKIIIGGLSMGGGMAYYASLIYPKYIAAQILFSPYIRPVYLRHFQTCLGGIFNKYGAEKTYSKGLRYPKISARAGCEASKTFVHRVLPLTRSKVKMRVPTFMLLTEYDTVVQFKYTVFMIAHKNYSELSDQQRFILFYLKGNGLPVRYSGGLKAYQTDLIPHASVLLKESVWDSKEVNPEYATMEESVLSFLQQQLKL